MDDRKESVIQRAECRAVVLCPHDEIGRVSLVVAGSLAHSNQINLARERVRDSEFQENF